MPRIQLILIGISLFFTPTIDAAEWLILEDLQLIDGTGSPPRHHARMVIREGRIIALQQKAGDDPAVSAAAYDAVTRINLAGAWVIPGLIDTHVHVARFPDARNEAERILRLAISGGVTSVRDLGGDARSLADLSRALGRGEWIGPTIAYSAVYGGLSLFDDERISGFARGYDLGQSPWAYAVDAETNLEQAIAASRGSGVHGVKIYGNLPAALTTTIIQAAKAQGLQSWAHATVFPSGPLDLVEAGVNSLSHAAYLVWAAVDEIPDDYSARIKGPWTEIAADHPRLIALYQQMAARQVSLDATLYVYEQMKNFSPQVDASWTGEAAAWGAQAVAAAHAHGVAITTGTDWFEPRPGELPHTHDEMALLVEKAGLAPMEAIVAATRNGAHALGIAEQRGTLEVGKAADLLVLEENPLTDISHTRHFKLVVKDGQLIRP
ncbi:MAG: amidohydrolase family protein [Wenzhouxiangellaceae bacterium]